MQTSPYGWLMLAGILASLIFWSRLARRDDRLLLVYVAALLGGFLGAKVVYFLAEGYQHLGAPDMWPQLATGKTILGGLLGGYLAVEIAKRLVGYPGLTGDWFTVTDPAGVSRWPSVPVEILFNVAMMAFFFILRRNQKLTGQHFHLYLIAYGGFRFLHEFLREEPSVCGPITGYQIAALAVAALGFWGFVRRAMLSSAGQTFRRNIEP